jgi:hypothetical protein
VGLIREVTGEKPLLPDLFSPRLNSSLDLNQLAVIACHSSNPAGQMLIRHLVACKEKDKIGL